MAQEFGVSSHVISGILGGAKRRLARVGLTPTQLKEAARCEAELRQPILSQVFAGSKKKCSARNSRSWLCDSVDCAPSRRLPRTLLRWQQVSDSSRRQSSRNTAAHNEIRDLFYTAISVGWTWGYAPNLCDDNRIEYNHLHDIGKAMLSDMGAIYTLGLQWRRSRVVLPGAQAEACQADKATCPSRSGLAQHQPGHEAEAVPGVRAEAHDAGESPSLAYTRSTDP
jgi:hypothetical protein